MIEHPDHTGCSSNPRAPWNAPDSEPEPNPVCMDCGEPMDDEAAERGGWCGELCSSCANEALGNHGCNCDEEGFCSPRCYAAWQSIEDDIRREILANPPSLDAAPLEELRSSDPVRFYLQCKEDPGQLP